MEQIGLRGWDMVYTFDDVNGDSFHRLQSRIWNHPDSKDCKILITNKDKAQMAKWGFKDYILKSQVCLHLTKTMGASESRVAHIYWRKSVPKSKMTFEFENPVKDMKGPFADIWKTFNKGRLDENGNVKANCRFNDAIINLNLAYDVTHHPDSPVNRSNRAPVCSNNFEELQEIQELPEESRTGCGHIRHHEKHGGTHRG
jgi:hypothetical protein